MGKISRAIGGMALCLLLLPVPLEALPLRVRPIGRNQPERFYAIPVNRVQMLSDPQRLRDKITCCRWGPHGLGERPDTSPGQWYIYPVCDRQLILSESLVGPSQAEVELRCP